MPSSTRSSSAGRVDPGRLLRFELALLAVFSAAWLAVSVVFFGLVRLAGVFDLDLYRLYSVAAVLGWVSGNVYVLRSRGASEKSENRYRRRWLLLTYFVGPPSLLCLIRALAPLAAQAAAPFVPIYALCVYCLFFLVPVTLRATRVRRR